MSKYLWCKLPADGCVKHLHKDESNQNVPLNVNIINITSAQQSLELNTHTCISVHWNGSVCLHGSGETPAPVHRDAKVWRTFRTVIHH